MLDHVGTKKLTELEIAFEIKGLDILGLAEVKSGREYYTNKKGKYFLL